MSANLSTPHDATVREIVSHYESCLSVHGDCPKGVDWPNAEDARLRYDVMLSLLRSHPSRPTLLDFGCGAAHLYDHLLATDQVHGVSYTGVDISPKFIDLARRKHPQVPLICADILSPEVRLQKFDYAVLNGVLTEKRAVEHGEMLDYAGDLLAAVFAIVRHGLAFNVMSTRVDWQRDDLFHLSLEAMSEMVSRRLSRHFVVRHDYGLYEYTVYVYREPRV